MLIYYHFVYAVDIAVSNRKYVISFIRYASELMAEQKPGQGFGMYFGLETCPLSLNKTHKKPVQANGED